MSIILKISLKMKTLAYGGRASRDAKDQKRAVWYEDEEARLDQGQPFQCAGRSTQLGVARAAAVRVLWKLQIVAPLYTTLLEP